MLKQGWFDTAVGGDVAFPCFSYTTGFHDTWGQPELFVTGIPPIQAHVVFEAIVEDLKNGKVLVEGFDSNVLHGVAVKFMKS